MANIEPERLLVNFLRQEILDINPGRTSPNWIFDDFPQVTLSSSNYPRISVTKITESGAPLGIFDDNVLDSVVFQIDVFAKKDKIYTINITAEIVGEISQDLSLDYVPYEVTQITHDGTPFGTITLVNDDSGLTTPAVDEVQVSLSSGRLRFNATDVTSYAGEIIGATYNYRLSNDKAANYLCRRVIETMRLQWRTNREVLGGLFYPVITQNINQPFDETRRAFRRTITCEWGVINAGTEL